MFSSLSPVLAGHTFLNLINSARQIPTKIFIPSFSDERDIFNADALNLFLILTNSFSVQVGQIKLKEFFGDLSI